MDTVRFLAIDLAKNVFQASRAYKVMQIKCAIFAILIEREDAQ
ncbi:hypothetical protein [Burkholderia stabilis]|nr:hypothetical protein [Burkholderia stabilis]